MARSRTVKAFETSYRTLFGIGQHGHVDGPLWVAQARKRFRMRSGFIIMPERERGMDRIFDVIIVGGGSAGAVLAARLSERSRIAVALIEAGPDTPPGREPPEIRDTYYLSVFQPKLFWPQLRAHFQPLPPGANVLPEPKRYEQARILGGGSSINAMIALRGLPGDFAEWAAAGAKGWSWEQVLPYFVKLERDQDFAGPLHGSAGPIPVRRHRSEQWPGFCQAVATALAERGWHYVSDMNGAAANGYCAVPMNSTVEQRVSTAMGYLTPEVRRRSNLHLRTEATVEAILFEDRRAVGVEFTALGRRETLRGREIVVAAGALQSPALLLKSGIGPAGELRAAGIAVRADRAGVGGNLQDHPCVSVACHLKPAGRQPDSLRPAPNLALRYDSGVEGCGASDMYVSVTNKSSWHALGKLIAALVVCVYKPYSRGRVSLDRIEFNLLSDRRDLARLAAGMRLAQSIYETPALRAVVNEVFPTSYSARMRAMSVLSDANRWRARLAALLLDGPAPLRRSILRNVVSPGLGLDALLADEAALEGWIRDRAVPFYHPVGTCRMGDPADPQAVVDPQARVIGVESLRVVDASIMPTVPRANTNLTTIMIGEKLADQMAGDAS